MTSESNYVIYRNPQIPIGIERKRVEFVMGIELNEHQIPSFQGKYSYHTYLEFSELVE